VTSLIQKVKNLPPKPFITGKNIDLRPIELKDSSFTLGLRLNPTMNRHLCPVSQDLKQQEIFIENSIASEEECYFIIQNKQANPIGTIRLYNRTGHSFSWGSWIIEKKARPYATLESAVLLYDYTFIDLKFPQAHFDVRKENLTVIGLHQNFGAEIIRQDQRDIFFVLKNHVYLKKRLLWLDKIEKVHQRLLRKESLLR
jgi:hypothetical protein